LAEKGRYPAAMPESRICSDLVRLPQDLTVYARQAGWDKSLLAPKEQDLLAERARKAFFAPWRQKAPSTGLKRSLADTFALRREAGFGENLRPFPPEDWAALKDNARPTDFPSLAAHAITVCATSLRAMPSRRPYFLDPDLPGEGYPFDYFQHSALWAGTPLFLSHLSRDGLWVLAETSTSSGWLPLRDTALVDADFERLWQSRPLAVLVRDKVALRGREGEEPVIGHTGALFPMAAACGAGVAAPAILYPRRADGGQARPAEAVPPPGAAEPFPLPLTPEKIARVGNGMLGQPYGWGGLLENRDCSSLIRDLFLPFGLWLPRNSAGQGKAGRTEDLGGLDAPARKEYIAARAVPFFSLIWLRGHIALYLGRHQGEPVIFHTFWGLRLRGPDPQDRYGESRAVIGKACVTGLSPGADLPDIASPNSLLDRMERLVFLSGAVSK
jgi:hypothetical protein